MTITLTREEAQKLLDGFERVGWARTEHADILRARLSAPEPEPEPEPVAWQPIDTAPKDGTNILVCCAVDADGTQIKSHGLFTQRAAWWGEEGWVVYCDIIQEPQCFFEPTHWMPVPPLYTAPPQRKWQGLTDEDLRQIILAAVGVAEAKLKEKNA